MKQLKFVMLSLLLCSWVSETNAQSKITSYSFKKGEVLDILVLTSKPETSSLFERYKKTAFPVAFKMSYQSLPGFKIDENVAGNHHPKGFILGKWGSIDKREKFLVDIDEEVPDFHEQRRDIFSFFGLTYYEIKEDVNFSVDRSKYNVVTAYWYNNNTMFSEFKNEWLNKVINSGGKTIIELKNGKSPYGYYYNPDYMVITQWDNKEKFENFKKKSLEMNHKGLQHVNQFVIK
ncbi:hypothetical protein U6A24_11970 [Aquimarina gracilis]|uniref:Uncharacterized protein n=1 Tax=Aquimarina gracilis TaxID=874422 RepID=A0ABU5ZWD3_9FLAO|nr:hypothetical protein [Aquimarina gracilis]MEB3346184.1 hypothetical protein [Aquimarina gracilis]